MTGTTGQPFLKMHGAGNDFVVLDLRQASWRVDPGLARALANRRTGVGCDQVISLEPTERGDVFMRIHNPDGSEAQACGNATRCIASLIFAENGQNSAVIETVAGLLQSRMTDDGWIEVDMGPAYLDWRDIPLAHEMDTLSLDLSLEPAAGPRLAEPCAVGMGNPHAVFFVDDMDAIDIPAVGPILEHHALFPERANIGFVQMTGADAFRLRVWERGAGLTLACGSGACAALVAAHRRGKCGRRARLTLDGGALVIEWRAEDGHVLMSGPVATSYAGVLDESLLAARQDPRRSVA
ncbi:MAG: diaminopimelate epimerase [Rhodospirillaceae bacterium]|jgi:diaminopimelate epimerase|nr:diaminopimelate epimerase [Rhodospirillaceae bacterium]MBT3494356.1 diaminopimelate epimerase [Rhodospirillaceae bacterium]MBT3780380.1 diaminopimelate epimerase [Rhodospirillaceae bacterium]MBT3979103.1 diaminopimelate epimerase [Rhodospirillaceae bacterium]MBT4171045.1 diaminopimelate epimerase [Rhodospirillaceae bacterium]